ncbi:hypothetical protein E1301_Tti010368 [Triplophysa tibetana]|uniref:Uncharacterized protein n=1 Tax=Triplophysa tibetana TaxID=1572043 RepID=A0A5A9PTA6_9TELE|nr:hypothetical protein E1301_Tti010368 [Triplophysa tibetana]
MERGGNAAILPQKKTTLTSPYSHRHCYGTTRPSHHSFTTLPVTRILIADACTSSPPSSVPVYNTPFSLSQRQREPIIRIFAVDRSPPMRYISISKGGTLAVWNSRLNITKQLRDPGEKCVLMWGDESGSVNLLWFLQPSKGLFETKFTKQTASVPIFMPDICTHSEFVTFQNIPHIHSQPINRILYEHHGELIITSSESTGSSVVIIDVHQKRQKYTWRIKKGVKCFDFSSSHSLLVTAGVDPAVRMWNRYVTSQPIAVLRSHKTNVVDVAIHQPMSKIFSYAKDSVVNIWDIPSQQCVKTIDLKFPHLQAGRVLEHGPFPLLLSLTADPALLVTSREYIAMLRLHKTESDRKHYTCALYSPHLEQVWNALNGHNLHKLEAVSDTEVTGIICHHDNQLIATGWSRLIAQYNIGLSNEFVLFVNHSFMSYDDAQTSPTDNKPIEGEEDRQESRPIRNRLIEVLSTGVKVHGRPL